MKTAVIAAMTDAQRLDHVRVQLNALEEEHARSVLRFEGIEATDLEVRRLVFARYQYMTLRMREHAI